MYEYDPQFLSYGRSVATRSARVIVPIVNGMLGPESVLDVGCGRGAWLEVWKGNGAREVVGVDGDYVDRSDLAIDQSEFRAQDLGHSVDLGRRFDLVESLEVAEHLQESRARGFVKDLCRHGGVVLFGAAPPGQGGEYHINEQPYDYWREFFAEFGYRPFDCIRPKIAGAPDVAPWYRYNTLLYVRDTVVDRLPEPVRRTEIAEGTPIADVSPPVYRLRKSIIRRLPNWATQILADVAKKLPRRAQ